MKPYCLWLITFAVQCAALPLFAADIASDVRNGGARETEDGGSFELGLVAGYEGSPLRWKQAEEGSGTVFDIDGSGEYRKNGFFVEATQGTQDGLNLGYTFWQPNTWQVDFLAGSMNGFYESELDDQVNEDDDEAERNKKIYERNTFYLGTGIRVTRYVDKYVVQYRLLTDTLDNNGVSSTLRVGRGWQYRNWNFYGIASAQYNSAKTNHMWFGVTENEATSRYPAYKPNSTLSYSMLLGVVRPLSEKWVFRAYAGWVQLPKEARHSPLIDDSDGTYALLTINRVFSWGS
ncbi:MipA/OmpV family protein [Teredinibacter haidensis]|uniref:MipA/OmpV family protein n=1 Tax=Teredinibacter haidensis TaxID=2731755 RepID=UPI000948EEA0|nr:MipA/OmpV family protein [Teredinibacter haidensis]